MKLRLCWTCSDFVKHEHRWRWSAWLCGRLQALMNRSRGRTELQRTKE